MRNTRRSNMAPIQTPQRTESVGDTTLPALPATNPGPKPGRFPLGSLKSRAAEDTGFPLERFEIDVPLEAR